jgi:ribosomal protein L37AE/L43A
LALSASCPSCGAPVAFKSASSVFAVCDYCQSTLVRHDQNLEDIGKMAALVEDRSPLQLGAEGSYKGVHFALIGRIQIKYSQGIWNEWHLLFDDMRTGWLSEAGGEYVLTFAQYVPEALPPFDDLKIGQRFVLASQTWTVSNIENAECIAGQGELPFKVGAGYPVSAVDLRNGANFATLDYSETPPLLFVGEAIAFKSLKMNNLRDGMAVPTSTFEARVFRCPSCGSPMQARSAEILAVGCVSCGAVVDTADENYKVLSKALGNRDEKYIPRLPLGSKGRLEDKPVEVIGFLVKQTKVDGISYDWREYLLAGEHGSYRWLTEYNGHWNIADVLSNPPASSGAMELADVRWSGQSFKHFATTPIAEVIQVAGEFTWRVKRGETNRVVDYVAPPLMLSRESTGNDLTWTQGFTWRRRPSLKPSNCRRNSPSRSVFSPTSRIRGTTPTAGLEPVRQIGAARHRCPDLLRVHFGRKTIATSGLHLRTAQRRRSPVPRIRDHRQAEENRRQQFDLAEQQLDRSRPAAGQQGHRRRLAGRPRAFFLQRLR